MEQHTHSTTTTDSNVNYSKKSKQVFEHAYEILATVQTEFYKVEAREQDGWELINIVSSKIDNYVYVAIFKRPISCKD